MLKVSRLVNKIVKRSGCGCEHVRVQEDALFSRLEIKKTKMNLTAGLGFKFVSAKTVLLMQMLSIFFTCTDSIHPGCIKCILGNFPQIVLNALFIHFTW